MSKGKVDISIVTVCRNEASALERCLRSVGAQSRPAYEHIVVDGRSTDGSDAIAKAAGVKVVSREPHGVYDAINAGIEICSGDVVGLLHANDVLAADDVLETVGSAFDEDARLDFVYADVCFVDFDNGNRVLRRYASDCFEPSQMRGGMAPPHPSLFMRRDLFRQVGLYKSDYIISADFDMWLRLFDPSRGLRYRYLPLTTILMSVGGLSMQWRNRLFVNTQEKLRALRENGVRPSMPKFLKRLVSIC